MAAGDETPVQNLCNVGEITRDHELVKDGDQICLVYTVVNQITGHTSEARKCLKPDCPEPIGNQLGIAGFEVVDCVSYMVFDDGTRITMFDHTNICEECCDAGPCVPIKISIGEVGPIKAECDFKIVSLTVVT